MQKEPAVGARVEAKCPACQCEAVSVGTVVDDFLYLRCHACGHVWTVPRKKK